MAFELFCYSVANLEGVTHVRPCRRADVVTGMVLVYRNGTRASLGWVSLDRLGEPKAVDNFGMWIAVTKSNLDFPRVTGIFYSRPEDGKYLHVRWHGKLEWWFSTRQCKLHHNGEHTIETRL
jgi:hypothetical protein